MLFAILSSLIVCIVLLFIVSCILNGIYERMVSLHKFVNDKMHYDNGKQIDDIANEISQVKTNMTYLLAEFKNLGVNKSFQKKKMGKTK